MNGTRLSKFMQSVQDVTGTMGVPEAATEGAASAAERSAGADVEALAEAIQPSPAAQELPPPAATPRSEAPLSAPNPWAPLIDVGMRFVAGLAAARAEAASVGADGPMPWLETDPLTGRQSLKLPLPEPASVQRLADALQGLLAGWKR